MLQRGDVASGGHGGWGPDAKLGWNQCFFGFSLPLQGYCFSAYLSFIVNMAEVLRNVHASFIFAPGHPQ